jgi:RNA polymerase sigma-70 factor (ECF subfamily)
MPDSGELPSDEILVRRVAAGERDALRILVDRHGARVHRLAARVLGNTEDAKDAAQDVFVAVFRTAASYRPEARFSTWLHRVTVNRCLGELESRRTRQRVLADLAGPAQELLPEHGGPSSDSAADPADEQLERRERLRRLETAFRSLPPRQQLAVALQRFEGLGYAEVAAALGCSVGSVESLLSRAKVALADKIDRR